MKELTTEEKAKRYDEAIKRAKAYQGLKSEMEIIFPELKESEDDNIRRWIINEIKIKHHNLDEDNVDFVDKAIAWLEKQSKKDEEILILKDKVTQLQKKVQVMQEMYDEVLDKYYKQEERIKILSMGKV